jgi:ABC-type Fe3+-hydroxamate transport system substrate-binding protein
MISLVDQAGNRVTLDRPAQRIVSLVPSQTELLYYFGLETETIGITKFCIHPDEWFRSKQRVGGTKNLALDLIKELKPDLIIANKEENTKAEIEALQKDFQVYISDVNTIPEALGMIKDVGLLSGKEQRAVDLIDDVQEELAELNKVKGRVAYFIWKNPYMVVGQSNYINSIINEIGLINAVVSERYVEIDVKELAVLNLDYIFLSTEPYPFKEEDKIELEKRLGIKVVIVDGEMFSWYGSRMLLMKDYFNQLTDSIEGII